MNKNTKESRIWDSEPREGIMAKAITFLISPVLGMFTALIHPNTRSSYFFLLLSFLTIGLTMNVPDERTEDTNFDSTTYIVAFENYAEYNATDFSSAINAYTEMTDEAATDIYAGMIYYIVSRFTNNYHVCFAVIALIFAYFAAITTIPCFRTQLSYIHRLFASIIPIYNEPNRKDQYVPFLHGLLDSCLCAI